MLCLKMNQFESLGISKKIIQETLVLDEVHGTLKKRSDSPLPGKLDQIPRSVGGFQHDS